MAKRNLSLTPRSEAVREQRPVQTPVHFTLDEIKKHFDESMNTVVTQYRVAESLLECGNIDGCKMIWRSQIVLAEGLLDFYLHEISKYCLFCMFVGKWRKSEKYSSLMLPLSKVEEGLMAHESSEWFFEYLNNRFSKDVFLSFESMKEQLNLTGIEFGKVMHKAFAKNNINESQKYGKEVVAELFKRRNEIAHQNDRSHASAEQNDITREYVEDYISKINLIVDSINTIAEEMNNAHESDSDIN